MPDFSRRPKCREANRTGKVNRGAISAARTGNVMAGGFDGFSAGAPPVIRRALTHIPRLASFVKSFVKRISIHQEAGMPRRGIGWMEGQMAKVEGDKARLTAIDLIEAQLAALPISAAMILQAGKLGNAELDTTAAEWMRLRRGRAGVTGSGGNIVAEYAPDEAAPDFDASCRIAEQSRERQDDLIRVLLGNALLAVGVFFREYGMASVRTPEVQFLGHVTDAVLNRNTFDIGTGYMPTASFDGLVVDHRLDGTPLFDEAERGRGLMAFGDVLALLQWLARYLRGERAFISWGDAG